MNSLVFMLKQQFVRRLIFVLLMSSNSLLWAQETWHDTFPSAISKEALPEGSSCKRDDIFVIEEDSVEPEIALNMACARSVREISTWLAQPETLLVDLRSPTEYQAFHVRNAVSLSVTSLLSKSYLRTKVLILMGSGKNEAEIYRACTRLKQSGYLNVFVAQGGILAWLMAGKETQGKAPDPTLLTQLSTIELWAEVQNPFTMIFLEKSRASLHPALPMGSILERSIISDLKTHISGNQKSSPLSAVVLITSPKTDNSLSEEIQQIISPLPLLFYSGSDMDFLSFSTQQEKNWAAKKHGPKTLRCGS